MLGVQSCSVSGLAVELLDLRPAIVAELRARL